MDTGGQQHIFTFDKKTEKKTGALTPFIFSVCLYLSTFLIALSALGLSVGTYLLSEMASIPIADGAVSDQSSVIFSLAGTTFVVGFLLILTFGLSAIKQLLLAYALEDGRLIRMKWKFRRVNPRLGSAMAGEIAQHLNVDRSTARQAISGIYAIIDGFRVIHNPMVLAGHLDGSAANPNIINMPLENITVLRKTKKKLVIMADAWVKNQMKRKKLTIYCMYHDMDILCSLCEGGSFVVD